MTEEDSTMKMQEECEQKDRRIAEAIFSASFLRELDEETQAGLEEDALKNTEIQQKIMNEINEAINRLNMESIDVRVLIMAFVRFLIGTIRIASENVEYLEE